MLLFKGGTQDFRRRPAGSMSGFAMRDFDRFDDGAVTKDSGHKKRIVAAPVFGLDMVALAANSNVGIEPLEHGSGLQRPPSVRKPLDRGRSLRAMVRRLKARRASPRGI